VSGYRMTAEIGDCCHAIPGEANSYDCWFCDDV
jgi:hypothetical protein